MSLLFSPMEVGGMRLNNRIVVPPMCQYSATEGEANDWHFVHYTNLAMSGAALLIIEATGVSPEGRISYADLGLWDRNTAYALAKVVNNIHLRSDTKIAIQLSHAGRKASTDLGWNPHRFFLPDEPRGWQVYGPSALPFGPNGMVPQALDKVDIQRIVGQFAAAAKLACSIGIDMVEIHAAHGYLIHQFLSPITNQRTDEYGGSLENRMRFGLEVFEAIKAAVPAGFPVGLRLSATDWIEGGWDIEQSIAFAEALDRKGCGYIHVSTGGLDPAQQILAVRPGYQLPFAEAIKKSVKMPVIGVGMITEPSEAEKALQGERADLIAIGRGMLFNPRWGWHAATVLGGQVTPPDQYDRSAPHGHQDIFKR